MPNVSSPLGTTQDYIPLIRADEVNKVSGVFLLCPSDTDLSDWVQVELGNIANGSPVWPTGQLVIVMTDPDGTARKWDGVSEFTTISFGGSTTMNSIGLLGNYQEGSNPAGPIAIGTNLSITGGVLNASFTSSSAVGWDGTLVSASPNTQIPVAVLTPTSTDTDGVDIVLAPKNGSTGIGSFSLQTPDSANSGGNKRGRGSIDFQTTRNSPTKVAGGARSSILSGSHNTISSGGTESSIGSGQSNSIFNPNCFIGSGSSNSISGGSSIIGSGLSNSVASTYSAILCGESNTVSIGGNSAIVSGQLNSATGFASFIGAGYANNCAGSYSFVGSGYSNHSSGENSWIPGGKQATTRGITGMGAVSGGAPFSNTRGEAQKGFYPLSGLTTNTTTPTILTTNGLTIGSTNRIKLDFGQVSIIKGSVIAKGTSGSSAGKCSGWTIEAVVTNDSVAGTMRLVGSPTVTKTHGDNEANSWSIACTIDNTAKTFDITVTGTSTDTIRWVAALESVEVI
jgi:hypothetical protein